MSNRFTHPRMKHLPSRHVGLVLLAASLLSGLAGCRGAQPRGEPLASSTTAAGFGARYDRAARYTLTLEAENEVGPGQILELRVSGKLEALPVKSSGGASPLALRLTGVRASSGGQDVPELARDLERAFSATFEHGRLKSVQLPRELSPGGASVMRTVAASLQLAAPTTAATAWRASELDGTGRYEVAYEASPAPSRKFTKKKLRYESLVANRSKLPSSVHIPSAQLELGVEVAEHAGSVELGADSTIESVSYSERLQATLLNDAKVSSTSKLTLSRVPGAPAAFETPAPSLLVSLVGDEPYPSRSPVDLDAQRVSGVTFEKLLADAEAGERSWAPPDSSSTKSAVETEIDRGARDRARQSSRYFAALEAMFRVQPDTVPRALGKIRSRSPAASLLTNALGSSNAPAAETALVTLLQDRSVERSLRASAANSLIRAGDPQPETVRAMLAAADDPIVGVHAIYALGSYARKLRSRDPSRSAPISRFLVEKLSRASQSAQRVHLLRGIANSGDPSALPAVRPYLVSADPLLRSAAVESMRLMQDPEVDSLIRERLEDQRSSVRRAALDTARARRATKQLAGAVERVATRADDGYSRMEAVRLLGMWLSQLPELREPLRRIAQNDEEPRIRQVAQKLVDG